MVDGEVDGRAERWAWKGWERCVGEGGKCGGGNRWLAGKWIGWVAEWK